MALNGYMCSKVMLSAKVGTGEITIGSGYGSDLYSWKRNGKRIFTSSLDHWHPVPRCGGLGLTARSTDKTDDTRYRPPRLFLAVLAIMPERPLIDLPLQKGSGSREYYILVGTVGTLGTELF